MVRLLAIQVCPQGMQPASLLPAAPQSPSLPRQVQWPCKAGGIPLPMMLLEVTREALLGMPGPAYLSASSCVAQQRPMCVTISPSLGKPYFTLCCCCAATATFSAMLSSSWCVYAHQLSLHALPSRLSSRKALLLCTRVCNCLPETICFPVLFL